MTIKIYQLLLGLSALLLAMLWFFLAPPALGGRTSYELVRGTSMSPYLHNGELAVVRTQSKYAPGDVVAYRNPDLHRLVLHRIVRRDGGRFFFKGDGNSFVDSAAVGRSALVGRLWFAIPFDGHAFSWARRPLHLCALLVVALLTIRMLTLVGRRGRPASSRFAGRHASSRKAPELRHPARAAAGNRPRRGWRAAVLFAGLGAVCLGLYVFGSFFPTSRSSSHTYVDRGHFSYSAVAPSARGVYPTGRATTGDPIFLRVVHGLDLVFAYRFTSALPHVIAGTASMHAVVHSTQGWTRTIVLQPPRGFRGDTVSVASTLSLDHVRELARSFEAATGVIPSTYTLTISPVIELHGSVASVSLSDRYAPSLQLQFDQLQLTTVMPTVLGSGPPPNPFTVSRTGVVRTASTPARITPGGPTLAHGRELLLATSLLALLAALGSGAPSLRSRFLRGAAGDPFGKRLISVAGASLERSGVLVVDVQDAESLMDLADELERPILHDRERDAYFVAADSLVYRHRAAPPARLRPRQEPFPGEHSPVPPADALA